MTEEVKGSGADQICCRFKFFHINTQRKGGEDMKEEHLSKYRGRRRRKRRNLLPVCSVMTGEQEVKRMQGGGGADKIKEETRGGERGGDEAFRAGEESGRGKLKKKKQEVTRR